MPTTHTQYLRHRIPDNNNNNPGNRQPIVTGTSVVAVQFKDGILMAADTLASYGSLARFRDERRLFPLRVHSPTSPTSSDICLLGASGDMGDMQHMTEILNVWARQESVQDDGCRIWADQVYEYVANLMYAKRSKMDPFWNTLVIAGYDASAQPVLGCVDLHGTTWQSPSIATGFGAYIAQPLLRKALSQTPPSELTYDQAKKLLEDTMRVLYYRDARSLNRIQLAVIWADATKPVQVTEPYALKTEWAFAESIRGYGRS